MKVLNCKLTCKKVKKCVTLFERSSNQTIYITVVCIDTMFTIHVQTLCREIEMHWLL